ncbi:ATP-binding protein [Salipaludibacillus sp. CUR1]|uniref:sensor histidine kinase n=1 Tax=Salipaludibacillus sp. CUR1 TaxID=2820003 RepID=UPI001E2B81AE|nr:ATP-binding protein [Salipaludibacillus sp. CUR1]MCE7791696.1 ATP-binding protein [Salipaludibacillus sp. CUR1]
MGKFFKNMTFRSKILSILLIITILLASFSFVIIQSIKEVNQVSDDVQNTSLPEHFWLSYWEQELRMKEYMAETAVETNFCCDFADTYEQRQQETEEQVREDHGPVPDSLSSVKREIDLLDFLVTNNVRGLVEYGNFQAAAALIEEEYLPGVQELHQTLSSQRETVVHSLEDQSDHISAIISESVRLLIIVTTVAVILAIAVSYKISAGLTEPVENIERKLGHIAKGKYGLTIEEGNQVELKSLTASINQMSKRLKESFDTIVNDKIYREQILNSLPLGIVTYNKKTGDLSLNDTAKEFLGNDNKKLMETLIKKDFNENLQFWERFSSPDIFHNVKIPFYTNSGTHFLLVSQSELLNKDQEMTGKIFYFLDITETEEMEKKIQQTEKLAVIGELSAGAAHEIRNPLAVIDGFLSLMNQSLSEEQKKQFHLPLLLKELDRINAIIEEMLMLTKPSAPVMEKVYFEKIVEDILPLIRQSAGYDQVEFKVDLYPSQVYVDSEQMKQVLHNLIRNSIEAMGGEGSITISSIVEYGNHNIYIRDTGPGISKKIQQQIFDPFLTSKESGTGLGLTIAQRIMDNHGGKLQLESTSSDGTCFLLSLPAAE